MTRDGNTAQRQALTILATYHEHFSPERVTDAKLLPLTGLTWGQYRNGKKALREFLMTETEVVYDSNHDGWRVTKDEGQAKAAAKLHAMAIGERQRMFLLAVIQPLEGLDLPEARRAVRYLNLAMSELSDIAELMAAR